MIAHRKTRVRAAAAVAPFVHALVAAVLLLVATTAFAATPSIRHRARFQSGAVRVGFVDSRGASQTAPYVTVADAYPGMPSIRTTATLMNTGTLPANYRVWVSVEGPGRSVGRPSLDDVLVTTVRDTASRILYRGRLSRLAFAPDAPLAPGAVYSFTVTIRWPHRASAANAYQGGILRLTLSAEATTLAPCLGRCSPSTRCQDAGWGGVHGPSW